MGKIFFSLKAEKNDTFKDLGIGRGHFWILRFLTHATSPVTVKTLAEELHVTSGAISQLVDSLVAQGYIERAENPRDRRSMQLILTTSARQVFQKLRKAHLAQIEHLFTQLTEPELAALDKLLVTIIHQQERKN